MFLFFPVFGFLRKMLKELSGPFSLVLERPFSPFPIHQLHLMSDLDVLFNRGRVSVASWNKSILASNFQTSSESTGNSGFVMFSSKFLTSQGWNLLNDQNGLAQPMSELVCIFSEEESGDGEWAHGNFPLEEYVKALDRSKGELYYNHSLGMRYSKVWCSTILKLYAPIIFKNCIQFMLLIHSYCFNVMLWKIIEYSTYGMLLTFLLLFILLDYRADICGFMYSNRSWCADFVKCCCEWHLF